MFGIIILTLFLGFVRYKRLINIVKSDWSARIKSQEDAVMARSQEFERLKRDESEITEKELAVVKLYEITKMMSAGLKFDDIFNIFSIFLKENFIFRKSELIILKETAADLLQVDRAYKVYGSIDAKEAAHEGAIDYDKLIKFFLRDKKELHFTREPDAAIFEDLKIGEDVSTFISIPLLSEKKVVGILTIEDIPPADRERFAILSMQFALELKKVLLYETVEALAITDSLTGLYLRRYFLQRLNEEVNRSKRYKFKFAYLMIDIDDFKKTNDTCGHLVGDVILRDMGRLIKASTREIDLVTRYGGEEFSLVLPETGREGALLVAERIKKKVEENIFRAYDEKLKATVSIGISIYPEDSNEAEDLIEKADRALYAAKNAGKNVVCIYRR